MPRRRTRVPMLDFSGGVNEDDLPGALAPNELRVARNVYWEGRALASRHGSSRLQSSAINSGAAVTGIWELVRSQGSTRNVIGAVGNKFYKDLDTASPTDITGAVTITAGQNNLVAFAHFNDLALCVNGVDAPWSWSGAGNAAVIGGTPPPSGAGTILAKWNRVFCGGHSAAPRTIRYTAIGDSTNWPAANTVAAILGDSTSAIEGRDFLYQLGHLGDSIFVGLANSIGRVLYTGDSTTPFRYTQLADWGCEGRFSYVAVGNGGYFLSQRGVHYVRPSDILITYESSLISGRRLRRTWADLNRARIKFAQGTLYRTSQNNLIVLWQFPSGSASTVDTCLLMDVTDGPGTERFAWWTGWDANTFGVGRDSSTLAEKLFFGTSGGFTWLGDTGTDDNGSAYVCEAATRWEDFQQPAEEKSLRDVYIEAKQTGSTLTVETYQDYGSTAAATQSATLAGGTQALWGTGVWGTAVWAGLGVVRQHLFQVGDGHVFSWRFVTTAANQTWAIYKLVPAVASSGESVEAV